MKFSFRHIGKIGFIFMAIGFLLPISGNQNGFQLAGSMMISFNGILFCLLLIYAVVGVILGSAMDYIKNIEPLADWVIITLCMGCGLVLYFRLFSDNVTGLQYGAFVILGGWIVALVFQILSKVKKEI